jgi:hypothetical protein
VEPRIAGRPLHARTLQVTLALAGDARWEARGVLLDVRKSGVVPVAGDLQTAGLLHHMEVRARIDPGARRIECMQAEQPAVAFEPSPLSQGDSCRGAVRHIEALAGASLDADYNRRLGEAIGGPRGCSHVLALARLVGATAAQLLASARPEGFAPGDRLLHRSLCLDGLESDGDELQVSLQLGDLYFAPAPPIARPMERFGAHRELRVRARLGLGDLVVRELRVLDRERRPPALDAAAWIDRSADVAGLVGCPAARGLGTRVLEQLDGRPELAPLCDALLQLAPGVMQCTSSRSETWPGLALLDPTLIYSGGATDSCYMWRRDGPLARVRRRERRGVDD